MLAIISAAVRIRDLQAIRRDAESSRSPSSAPAVLCPATGLAQDVRRVWANHSPVWRHCGAVHCLCGHDWEGKEQNRLL